MIDDLNLDPLPGLPPDLAELDQELRELRIAERSSFSPELRAELEQAWSRPDESTERFRRPSARALATAATLAVLFGGLVVPPARASLVNLSRSALESIGLLEEDTRDEDVSLGPLVATPPTVLPVDLDDGPVRSESEVEPPPPAAPEDPHRAIAATFPELLHRAAEEDAIRRYYPHDLQSQGIGGTVRVRIWVDSFGRVDNPSIHEGSGVTRLDRAGLLAVEELEFVPATRGGVAVGTWADVDLVFSPSGPEDLPLPALPTVAEPQEPEGLDLEFDGWIDDVGIRPPGQVGARELLRSALSALEDEGAELGSVDELLMGDPPDGAPPLAWRARAMDALDRMIAAHPENPAPYLAMGRLLRKQGLIPEGRDFFERGLATTPAEGDVRSAEVQAELRYELGLLEKEAWLEWRDLGRISAAPGDLPRCARGPRGTGEEAADLIALNYLCPASMGTFLDRAFRPLAPATDHRRTMMEAFEDAVEANPAHTGANVEILLQLADEERWEEVLDGSLRFSDASNRHPHALLLKGLALQRLGRSEEAWRTLGEALAALPRPVARSLGDPRWVMEPARRDEVAGLSNGRRSVVVEAFWESLDPILLTTVNERRVEHVARSGEAFLRFGTEGGDAQELWVRYGPPQRIRTIGEGTELRTEFWDYGPGPDLTFRRPAVSPVPKLTPEGRAYLGDLRRSFPEWYGHRSRRVHPVAARVARFRSPGGGTDVEIAATLPREFRESGASGLILGVFTLDENGGVLTGTREPMEGTDIRRTVRAGENAWSVVVEVWDPARVAAATLRTLASAEGGSLREGRMSDLALLSAAVVQPGEPIARGDALPLLPPGDVPTGRVDVFFELYEAPRDPYRIRVDARPEGGGEAIPLRVRRVGDPGFRDGWLRGAGGSGTVAERLTLDLSGLSEGAWVLRVSVELEEGAHVVERTTVLRIPPPGSRGTR